MALAQFLFETGPAGDTLTHANCGSSAGSVGGGTQQFSAAMAAHGTFGALFTNAAGAGTFRRWLFTDGPATTWAFSGILTMPASAPAAAIPVAGFSAAGGALDDRTMQISTAGRIRWNSVDLTAPGILTWGAKHRITILYNATAGSYIIRVYSETSPGSKIWTALVGSAHVASGLSLNTTPVQGVDLGIPTAPGSSSIATIGWDDLQIEAGRTTEIPDWAAPLATPTVTLNGVAPTSHGGADGTITATWPTVAGADHYESCILAGTVTTGFAADDADATSPKVYTGLTAGAWTVAVRAIAGP